jgi:hypothetical protein
MLSITSSRLRTSRLAQLAGVAFAIESIILPIRGVFKKWTKLS